MTGEEIVKIVNQLYEIGEIATVDISDDYKTEVNIMMGAFRAVKSRATKTYGIKGSYPHELNVTKEGFDFDNYKQIRNYYPWFKIHILLFCKKDFDDKELGRVYDTGEGIIEKLHTMLSDVDGYRVYGKVYTSHFSKTLRIDFEIINDTEALSVTK